MIEINGLQKSFGELTVLESINIQINDGDIYGLVGKSGAGKSTLLNCINGLETYDGGSLKVNEVEVSNLNKKELQYFRKDIAMIFQDFALMSRKTVYDNIAFPMKCWKYDKKQIDARVRELAEIVGISDKLWQKPEQLSGGQKQRVAIARALSMEPKILLCDEATSALDPTTTNSILQLLKQINERIGITIVIVTHQMDVVKKICKNISLLQKGHIVVSGPVDKLFLSQPTELRLFMDDEDLVPTYDGVNLQIMFFGDDDSKSILSAIAKDLNIEFSVVGGKVERYQDRHIGTFIINFDNENIQMVKDYLDNHHIIWHEYKDVIETVEEEGTC